MKKKQKKNKAKAERTYLRRFRDGETKVSHATHVFVLLRMCAFVCVYVKSYISFPSSLSIISDSGIVVGQTVGVARKWKDLNFEKN